MGRKSTRTQGVKRKIAILLSIALLFTLAFTGTALAEEVTAYESVNYAELEECLENDSPGDDSPFWDWTAPDGHFQLIPASFPGLTTVQIRLLRAGIMFPDGLRRGANGLPERVTNDGHHPNGLAGCNRNGRSTMNLGQAEYRSFHGYHVSRQNGVWREANYVAAYSFITQIANRGGATGGANWSLLNPGLTGGTRGALYNIRSRFRRSGDATGAEGMRCGTCNTFRDWQWIMNQNNLGAEYRGQSTAGQQMFRRFFIWGIALHALSDAFEHSALVQVPGNNALWHTIIHNNNLSAARGVRFLATQDAVNAALRFLASGSGNSGCCCQFRAAVGRFTGNNFRLANLTRYSNQNAVAVPHRGALNATERRQLRNGDILFRTDQNAAYSGSAINRCSFCQHPFPNSICRC